MRYFKSLGTNTIYMIRQNDDEYQSRLLTGTAWITLVNEADRQLRKYGHLQHCGFDEIEESEVFLEAI